MYRITATARLRRVAGTTVAPARRWHRLEYTQNARTRATGTPELATTSSTVWLVVVPHCPLELPAPCGIVIRQFRHPAALTVGLSMRNTRSSRRVVTLASQSLTP